MSRIEVSQAMIPDEPTTDSSRFDRWRRAAHSRTPPLYVLRRDNRHGPLYLGSDGRIHDSFMNARKFSLPADAEVYREDLIYRLTAAGDLAYAEAIRGFVVELVSDAREHHSSKGTQCWS